MVGVRDPEVQMERLRARDAHLSAEEARDRVRSQEDVRVRAARSEARGQGRGYVVWNDGTREELELQLGEVVRDVEARNWPRWSPLARSVSTS